MISLKATIRKDKGKKAGKLRGKDSIPAVLYGRETDNILLQLNLKEFEKVYKEAGESTLLTLEVDKKKIPVLIHEFQKDPVSDKFIHVDFYKPSLTEKVEATVPLVFVGESEAVKGLSGTLIKNIDELLVKALPQDLPHEFKVDISKLNTFEDSILVKDLTISPNVEIMKDKNEIVALVQPPTKVEEELEKPIEEKVEEVEKVEKKEKEEEEKEEETTPAPTSKTKEKDKAK